MRSIYVLLLIMTVLAGKNAIAITNTAMKNTESSIDQMETTSSSTISLLSWRDNKIYTNKGVFVTDGVQVVNNSGLEQERMSMADPPLRVELVVESGMVKKMILLRNK